MQHKPLDQLLDELDDILRNAPVPVAVKPYQPLYINETEDEAREVSSRKKRRQARRNQAILSIAAVLFAMSTTALTMLTLSAEVGVQNPHDPAPEAETTACDCTLPPFFINVVPPSQSEPSAELPTDTPEPSETPPAFNPTIIIYEIETPAPTLTATIAPEPSESPEQQTSIIRSNDAWPESDSPHTGDIDVYVWLCIYLMAGSALVALYAYRRMGRYVPRH